MPVNENKENAIASVNDLDNSDSIWPPGLQPKHKKHFIRRRLRCK
jgi:hypothetical protein